MEERTATQGIHALASRVAALGEGSLAAKLSALVVTIGTLRIALHPASIQHDVAMYLHAGQLLLRGQRPYVDFIDLNPPLIMYLSAIPAAVAQLVGRPVVPIALLMVAAAGASSLAWTRRMLLATFEEVGEDPLLANALVLALAYAFFLIDLPDVIDLPFPGNAPLDPRLSMFFGQREHLFVIGTSPFLALRLRRWEGLRVGRVVAIVSGVVASIVTCLKPQFAVVLVAFELGHLASRRRAAALVAPENAAFVGVVLAYAAHFALLPSDVRAAWFGRWLPFVVEGYGVFNEPSLGRLLVHAWAGLAAVVAAFGVRFAGGALGQRLIRSYGLMALAGAVLYVGQRKGWTYHAYPLRTFATVVAVCMVAGARPVATSRGPEGQRFVLSFSRQRLGQLLVFALGASVLALAAALATLDTAKDIERLTRRSAVMRTIETLTAPGDPVLIATTAVWFPYPAFTLMNRAPGSRYAWLFPIPMLRAVSNEPEAEAAFVGDLAHDIHDRRPKLILLQLGRCFGCGSATVDGFFQQHAALVDALAGYAPRGSIHDGSEFQVYVRTAPDP